jgi:hypothetical protein
MTHALEPVRIKQVAQTIAFWLIVCWMLSATLSHFALPWSPTPTYEQCEAVNWDLNLKANEGGL